MLNKKFSEFSQNIIISWHLPGLKFPWLFPDCWTPWWWHSNAQPNLSTLFAYCSLQSSTQLSPGAWYGLNRQRTIWWHRKTDGDGSLSIYLGPCLQTFINWDQSMDKKIEWLEWLDSENTPPFPTLTAVPLLPILSILIGSLLFQVKTTYEGYNHKSVNLTKPKTYVKGYSNYYFFSNLEVLALKMASEECEKVQITNEVIMCIFNGIYNNYCYNCDTLSSKGLFPYQKWNKTGKKPVH